LRTSAGEASSAGRERYHCFAGPARKFHQATSALATRLVAPLITCEPVIAESCHLLRHIPGAAEAILDNVSAGFFEIPFQLSRETRGVLQILRKYADKRIDLADAGLVLLAEEFGTGDILTLDHDFLVYRWGKNRPFHILIEA
jgi:uncharacterized protein